MTLWLDPFRVDVHRTDGSVVVESAPDSEGRYWTYATLNDAWTTRRRIGRDDAIYGLGEKGGHHNRRGRDFTMWNTDVLNEHATAEFRAGLDADDPRADMTSTEFDPYYVTIPFFYQRDGRPALPSARSSTTATGGSTSSAATTSTASPSTAGSGRSTSSPGRRWRASSSATRG